MAVLVAALCGMNVIAVLSLGIVLCGISGMVTGSAGIWDWTASMGEGVVGMGELIIITLLAAGVFEMMRLYGGISWLTHKLTRHLRSRKGAEGGYLDTERPCRCMHRQQYRCPDNDRSYRQGNIDYQRYRPSAQRQPDRHFFVCRSGDHTLRRPDAYGGKFGWGSPARNPAVYLLPVTSRAGFGGGYRHGISAPVRFPDPAPGPCDFRSR